MKSKTKGDNEVRSEKSSRRLFQEYSEALVVAIILAFLIKAFLFQAFDIPSGSMEPTLLIGDHILVNKFIYGWQIPFSAKKWPGSGIPIPFVGKSLPEFRKPRRGDVIVFVYPLDRSKDFIKRVIAVGGDTLTIIDRKIFINGKAVKDPHAYFSSDIIYPEAESPRDNLGPITVPQGDLFVMGDNRDNSYDSRFWGFVPLRNVVGEALIIYYSAPSIFHVRWNRFFKVIR